MVCHFLRHCEAGKEKMMTEIRGAIREILDDNVVSWGLVNLETQMIDKLVETQMIDKLERLVKMACQQAFVNGAHWADDECPLHRYHSFVAIEATHRYPLMEEDNGMAAKNAGSTENTRLSEDNDEKD
jgi:hypothetical protein